MAPLSNQWKKVVIFLGSIRENRLGERVAKFVSRKLKEKHIEVVLIDPVKFTLPLLVQPAHFYKPPDKPPQKIVEMSVQIQEADAVIVVSAEYNHSIPPALSNTIDHFAPSVFANKPSGIVTYSPSILGGSRASVQLRALLGFLGCLSVSHMLTVTKAHTALNEEGIPQDTEEGSHMDSSCEKLLSQLEWWANAAKAQRNASNSTVF